MEATVAAPTQEAPAEPEPSHDGQSEATRSTEELFQWSGYVNVGAGAEECEHADDGECTVRGHFHAWVCLPNQFQVRDITDKARAAKARKTRALRDPESDSHEVMEAELDELREGERFEALLKNLATRAVEAKLLDLVDSLQQDERFENHAQDTEELRRLEALPEDERDPEEYERLQADVMAYGERLQEVVEEREAAELAHLRNKSADEVIDMERKSRIENISNEIYLHTYYTWAMYVGARVPSTDGFPSVRKFRQPDDLRNAPAEVITALREKIRDLEERTVRGDAAGN